MFFYCGAIAAYIVLEIIRNIVVLFITTNASEGLHNKMFRVILGSKITFFERTPIGKHILAILNYWNLVRASLCVCLTSLSVFALPFVLPEVYHTTYRHCSEQILT